MEPSLYIYKVFKMEPPLSLCIQHLIWSLLSLYIQQLRWSLLSLHTLSTCTAFSSQQLCSSKYGASVLSLQHLIWSLLSLSIASNMEPSPSTYSLYMHSIFIAATLFLTIWSLLWTTSLAHLLSVFLDVSLVVVGNQPPLPPPFPLFRVPAPRSPSVSLYL